MANKSKRDKIVTEMLTGRVEYVPTIEDINRALASGRERVLTNSEVGRLIDAGIISPEQKVGWLPQLFSNIGRNAMDTVRGIRTFGTLGQQYLAQGGRKLRDKLANTQSGEYPVFDWINSGIEGAVDDYLNDESFLKYDTTKKLLKAGVNVGLAPLYTDVDDIASASGKEIVDRIIPNAVFGLYDNPIDNLPITSQATRLIPKGAVAKGIHKLPIPQGVKNLVETPEMKKVNSILADSKATGGVKITPTLSKLDSLKTGAQLGKFKPEDVVRNLRTGNWQGDSATINATKKMAEVSNEISDLAYQLGVPRREMDNVVRANALLEQLDPTRSKGYTTGGLQRLIEDFTVGKPVETELLEIGHTPESFETALRNLDVAQDQGRLAHISQVFAGNLGDGSGINTPLRSNRYLSPQEIGTATSKQLGDVLFDTYDFLGHRIEDALSSNKSINEIAHELGTKVTPDYRLKQGEAFISPMMIRDAMRTSYANPGRQLSSAIKTLNNDSAKGLLERYGDDLYKVDENWLTAVVNSQAQPPLGWLDSANSAFKSAQLTTPKFVTDNRLGNLNLNLMEGVGLNDYIDAWSNQSIMPSKLKQQTSYSGFLGKDASGSPLNQATLRAFSNLIDKNASGWDRLKNFNLLFANPIISLESKLEGIDRYANMIRQAKRKGGDWKGIIKQTEDNPSLYRELNDKVNSSLGDYAGRNYFINPVGQQALSTLYNFYKYPAQSGRVLLNQAKNRPLAFEGFVNAPAQAGNEFNQLQEDAYGVLPNSFKGGVIAQLPLRRNEGYVVDSYQASPITAPLEVVGSIANGKWDEAINLSPILSDFDEVVNFKNPYGSPASTPNTVNSYGNMVGLNDEGIPVREMVNPTLIDKARLAGSLFANQMVVPVVQLNRWIDPWYAYGSAQPLYRRFDTSILGQVGDSQTIPFLREGNKMRPARLGFEDLIENMMGTERYQAYPESNILQPNTYKNLRRYNSYMMRKLGE